MSLFLLVFYHFFFFSFTSNKVQLSPPLLENGQLSFPKKKTDSLKVSSTASSSLQAEDASSPLLEMIDTQGGDLGERERLAFSLPPCLAVS